MCSVVHSSQRNDNRTHQCQCPEHNGCVDMWVYICVLHILHTLHTILHQEMFWVGGCCVLSILTMTCGPLMVNGGQHDPNSPGGTLVLLVQVCVCWCVVIMHVNVVMVQPAHVSTCTPFNTHQLTYNSRTYNPNTHNPLTTFRCCWHCS